MSTIRLEKRGYILAALAGAIGGGMLVMIAGEILPRIMSEIMSGMMRNMMTQMGEEGCNPEEM